MTLIFFPSMPVPKLLSIPPSTMQCGAPMPFPVFDARGTLLLAEGQEVSSTQQLDALLQIGLFRMEDWPQPTRIVPRDSVSVEQSGGKVLAGQAFSQLKLQPGAVLHVRRCDVPEQAFVAVDLLGWQPARDILISAVAHNGQKLSLPVGVPLEVKLLAGKGVIAFESCVRMACQSPYPYWHLDYPHALVVRQLRKSLRASVRVPVQVSSDGEAVCEDCMIVNLSAYGGLLEVPILFAQKGDTVHLTFVLSVLEQEHLLTVHGVVRNLHSMAGSLPMVQYGLEFLHVATAERLLLEHYIFQCLLNA